MNHVTVLILLMVCVGLGVQGQDYHDGQYPSSTPLFGVTYSPFALDLETMCLPPEQVETDMQIIKEVADHVRIYNLASCPENVEIILRFCVENNMRVILGIYISGDEESNDREMNALAPLLQLYGQIVDAVVVGNETLFLEILPLDQLISYIEKAKAIVADSSYQIPVSTGEVWPVYESDVGPQLVEATDFVCMNMQPYWEGWDIVCPTNIDYECASAGDYVHRKAAGLEGYFQKPVWVCESGWPTEGERCCEGRDNARDGLLAGPHTSNSTVFISELVDFGREANRPTYVHAMFDEDWKRIWAPCGTCEGLSTLLEDPTCDTCEVDYHFGIYTFDRTLKAGLQLPNAA